MDSKERIIEGVKKPVRRKSVGIKFPDVRVQLVGEDGNSFAIMGKVSKALRRAGKPPEAITEFMQKSTQCTSYDAFLQHVMKTVSVS